MHNEENILKYDYEQVHIWYYSFAIFVECYLK